MRGRIAQGARAVVRDGDHHAVPHHHRPDRNFPLRRRAAGGREGEAQGIVRRVVRLGGRR